MPWPAATVTKVAMKQDAMPATQYAIGPNLFHYLFIILNAGNLVELHTIFSKKASLDNKIMMSVLVIFITYSMTVYVFNTIVYAQIEDLKDRMLTTGKINSSLKDADRNTIWILSGHWKSNLFNNTKFNDTNPGKFTAVIDMVMANGSSPHKHKVSHFTLTNMSTEKNSTVYKGTLSVSMNLGPVFAIPVTIRNFQNETISISLEPLEGITSDQMNVVDHFDNKPITGTFTK